LQNPNVMRNLVNDSTVQGGNTVYTLFQDSELDLIEQFQAERLARQMASTGLLPRQKQGLNNLYLANSTRDELDAFAALLPEEFEPDNDFRAAQLALLAYQSGLCVSAQLGFNGFDTHQTHDEEHFTYLEKLTDLVAYLFDTAEEAGFADRLVVTMGSDFGRTPYYNRGGGKDHWPIGSAIIIKPGAEWGNRVVGATDEGHNALEFDPQTLQVDNNGLRLEPKHVHQALRELAGVEANPVAQEFPLNAEAVAFFNPDMQTS